MARYGSIWYRIKTYIHNMFCSNDAPNHKWLSVNDVLPNEGQLVLTFNPYIQMAIYHKKIGFQPCEQRGLSFYEKKDRLLVQVTHWIPIEIPKQDWK